MSKDFPYFRFTCQEWQNGDITLENMATQGLFINICAFYWINNCEISIKKLIKKFKKYQKKIEKLFFLKIIYKKDDDVCIPFLDRQWAELTEIREKRQKAGIAGGKQKASNARRLLKQNPSYKDKDKDKDKEKDNIKSVFPFSDFWEMYGKKTGRKKAELKYQKVSEADRQIIKEKLPLYIESTPEVKYRKDPSTWLNGEHWNDEIILTEEQKNAKWVRDYEREHGKK